MSRITELEQDITKLQCICNELAALHGKVIDWWPETKYVMEPNEKSNRYGPLLESSSSLGCGCGTTKEGCG